MHPGIDGARRAAGVVANLRDRSIAVVVPCYCEEGKIGLTLAGIPYWITRIYVVDDASRDNSIEAVESAAKDDPRITLIRHERNRGVGAAIATGYLRCVEDKIDFAIVMAGDGQMNPDDLPALMRPALLGQADYVKGNRFFHSAGLNEMPRHRLLGNLVLSMLTKIASGYWHVSDTQCGYTVINRSALRAVAWDQLYPRYGCPNDMLVRLNVANMRVAEVTVHPIYGPRWASSMRVSRVVWPILALLARLFCFRLYRKYVFMNGHPIIIFYLMSALLGLMSAVTSIYILIMFALTGVIPKAALILFGIAAGATIQLVLGAFTLDFQANEKLAVFVPEDDWSDD